MNDDGMAPTCVRRSFILALHVFNLLFLRLRLATAAWTSTIATLLGWVGVLFIVVLGPLAIHKKEKGDFYGPSGYWCVGFPIVRTSGDELG